MSHPFGTPSPTIADLIEAHRAACLADEANFDYEGVQLLHISDAHVSADGAREIEAFKAMVTAPCQTADDVQAKLRYLLVDKVRQNGQLVDYLAEYTCSDFDGEMELLRSLLIEARG